MSKLKIIKFGDKRGVGAIVEVISLLGIIVRTWTIVESSNGIDFDKWVCRETGEWEYRGCCDVCLFYAAQFNTSSGDADGQ